MALRNPLGEEQGVMRTTLLPGMLQVASANTAWGAGALRFFEVGKVFRPVAGQPLPSEDLRLCVLATGMDSKGWAWPAHELDFFQVKGVLTSLLDFWGLAEKVSFIPGLDLLALHPGRRAGLTVGETEIGWVGELYPGVQEVLGLPSRVCLFELDLEKVYALASSVAKTYRAWSRFPAVSRDIAILVPSEVTNAEVETSLSRFGRGLLGEFYIFDWYQGDQVPEGYKSLAYRLVFQSADHTLTEKEITGFYDEIVRGLETELGAQLRR